MSEQDPHRSHLSPNHHKPEGVPHEAAEKFEELLRVMNQLRSPGGCLWDAQQTHESLLRYLVEETYEVVDAIEAPLSMTRWRQELVEELGDVLLQVVFHARIGQEHPGDRHFDITDVLETLTSKLVRRHPDVFAAQTEADYPPEANSLEADREVLDQSAVMSARWDALKRAEKPERTTVFAGVPSSLPALAYAEKALSKARRHGVEPKPEIAQDGEAAASTSGHDLEAQEHELGEQLFAQVRAASARGLDSERALRGAVRRFMSNHDRDL